MTPVRLEKVTPKMSTSEKVQTSLKSASERIFAFLLATYERIAVFLNRYGIYIILICIVILFILIGIIIGSLLAMDVNSTVIPPMTESNGYYYQLKNL